MIWSPAGGEHREGDDCSTRANNELTAWYPMGEQQERTDAFIQTGLNGYRFDSEGIITGIMRVSSRARTRVAHGSDPLL